MYQKQTPQFYQSDRLTKEKGFSLIELLVVVVMLTIMLAISFAYLSNERTAYRSDQQALQVVDILQQARLNALNNRRTMRVEINLTTNLVRLIDENTATTDSDDVLVKTLTLPNNVDIRVDRRPANIPSAPSESTPTPEATFATSVYTQSTIGSTGQNVYTLRFLQNGTVVNAGTNSVGANAVQTGATIYVWTPNSSADLTNTGKISGARAITVLATGAIRMWYQIPANAVANGIYWRNTR